MVPIGAPHRSSSSAARTELLRWTAGLGAVTAESLALRLGTGVAAARSRLLAAERDGLLIRHRPLVGRPALYTATRPGLRAATIRGLDPGRVSAASALHQIECARCAAALERSYPDHRVAGERELRREEREHGQTLASAELGVDHDGQRLRRRPDLVLWALDPDALPVAVEVELTVKAPARLAQICRAWARARCVAGTLYIAAPDVERALLRAVERAQAHGRVAIVPLDVLPASSERSVPSAS